MNRLAPSHVRLYVKAEFFNPASSINEWGASKCGIHKIRTLVTRGVLLDVARAKGVDILEGGYAITGDDLDAACEMGKVEVRAGDIVLVRTGQMKHLATRDLMTYGVPAAGPSTTIRS